MADIKHNEPQEGYETLVNRTAIYKGIQLGKLAITRVTPNIVHDDNSMTTAQYKVVWETSAAVKALIDASLAHVDPPAPPVPPPAPPESIDLNAQFTVQVNGARVIITDTSTGAVKEQWSWGDGGTSTIVGSQEKVYRYAKTYTIKLIAWDKDGKTSTASQTVTTTGDSGPAAPPTGGTGTTPPPAPPPADPGQPAPSVIALKPPVSPVGSGKHSVYAEVEDAAKHVWFAVALVGEDITAPGLVACLVDADGAVHPVLQGIFYADCCYIHAARMDVGYDELGCMLTVTYDGLPVTVPPSSYEDGTYDFWNGCRMPAIRYGRQLRFEDLKPIDWSVLPRYTTEKQLPFDDSKMDYTFNGSGCTHTIKMGTTGERGEIGYMQQAYMSFILSPCQETWEVVRRAEDWSGVWSGVYHCEPATGGIIKYTDYEMATALPPAQAKTWQSKNPIAAYGGGYRGDTLIPPPDTWTTSGSPYAPNTAHLTSYGMLAAMLTGARNDLDNASFWANYCFIDQNPVYTRSGGFVWGAQRRFAWALRSVFIAAYYSSDTEYFSAELDRNLEIANKVPKNQWGILTTDMGYVGKGLAAGYKGVALWMQSYLASVLDPVQRKRPGWQPFTWYIAELEKTWAKYPFALCRTVYSFMCADADGNLLDNFPEMVKISLMQNGFDEASALAVINAKTVQEAYDAVVAQSIAAGKPWAGKCVDGVADYMGYLNSSSSYPIGAIMSIISAANSKTPDIDQALYIAQHQPTPIDTSKNQKYNLRYVP